MQRMRNTPCSIRIQAFRIYLCVAPRLRQGRPRAVLAIYLYLSIYLYISIYIYLYISIYLYIYINIY